MSFQWAQYELVIDDPIWFLGSLFMGAFIMLSGFILLWSTIRKR